jgi:hypothetical protein
MGMPLDRSSSDRGLADAIHAELRISAIDRG